jgi:hypothetical protein
VFLQMVRAGPHFSGGPVDMPSQELSCAMCAVCAACAACAVCAVK